MQASAISGAAGAAVHDAKPVLEKLARVGFFAVGLLYMTIGALATAAALRLGGTARTSAASHAGPGNAMGQRGAMGALLEAPAGRALLVAIALGLFGYAAWQFVVAIRDPMHHPRTGRRIVARVSAAGLGIGQVALAISALKIAFGHLDAANDGQASKHWTARALATPGGTVVLWVIAASFIGYGIYQLYLAWKAKLDRQLMLGRLSARAQRWVVAGGRLGIAAHGIVWATTGVAIVHAVEQRNPQRMQGMKTSLVELLELGRWPFAIVAVGLVAYGVYQIINALYRRIEIA